MRLILLAAVLALGACSSPEERARDAMADFETAFGVGDYINARNAARQAVGARDGVPNHWLALARAEMALGNPGGAYAAYIRVHELDRNNVEALQALGQLSFSARRLDAAQDYAEQLLKLEPRNSRALLALGYIALERKQYPAAVAKADQVLAAIPLDYDALVLKGKAMSAGGKSAEAAAMIEQAMRVRGIAVPMLEALAGIYREGGDLASLQRTYARILEIEPQHRGAKLENLRLLYARGESAKAFEIIEGEGGGGFAEDVVELWLAAPAGAVPAAEVLRLAQGASGPAKVAYSRFLLERGLAAEVERLLRPFARLEVSPQTADATALHASALHQLGRTDSALAAAGRVLEFDPAHPRSLRLRAEISLARRDYNQALVDAQILVRDQPTMAANRVLLASIYRAKGEHRLAELTYKKAYKDFPRNELVFSHYLSFLRERKQTPAALTLAESFTSGNRQSASGWRAMAELCGTTGNRQCAASAQQEYQRLRRAS